MATVPTAPNDSSNDRSGTEIDDREEKHKEEEVVKDSGSDPLVMDATVSNKVNKAKIAELQKQKQIITGQYKRVLKQRDDNIRKHATSSHNKKILINSTKKLHKIKVTELRSQIKCLKNEQKDKLKD
jgi:hypothetical protein